MELSESGMGIDQMELTACLETPSITTTTTTTTTLYYLFVIAPFQSDGSLGFVVDIPV